MPSDVTFGGVIADLDERGARIVISQHPRRAKPLPLDRELYEWRHLIENFFCKLNEFKRIALQACKTDQSFPAMIHLTAAVINSRWIPTNPTRGRDGRADILRTRRTRTSNEDA